MGTPSPTTDIHIRREVATWGSPTTLPTLTIENATNTIATGSVRLDLINGDTNKWSYLFGGNGNTNLNLQYNSSSRMTFASSGNVGIGTTSPAELFEVRSPGTSPSIRLRGDTQAGLNIGLDLYSDTSLGGQLRYIESGSRTILNTQHGIVSSRSVELQLGGTTYMGLYNSGNVGIGTNTPSDKLHVEGKIRAQEICDTAGTNCKVISGGWTAGSVTSVGVSGLPLSIASGSTTPQISIAQANGAQAGFLSSADWTAPCFRVVVV